jgi:hypothetical protein
VAEYPIKTLFGTFSLKKIKLLKLASNFGFAAYVLKTIHFAYIIKLDIDGDGVVSAYEFEFFYEEQCQRMEDRGIEPVAFADMYCQL